MIDHLVSIKLKPSTTPQQRQDLLAGLRGLRDQVPGVVDLTAGENFSERAQGFEIGVMVRFADRAALDAYGPHPAHQKVVQELLLPIREDIIVLDYDSGQ